MEKNLKPDKKQSDTEKNHIRQVQKPNSCIDSKLIPNGYRKNPAETLPNRVFNRRIQSTGDLDSFLEGEMAEFETVDTAFTQKTNNHDELYYDINQEFKFRQKILACCSQERASHVGSQIQILNDSLFSTFFADLNGKTRPENPVVQKLMASSKVEKKECFIEGFKTPVFYFDVVPPNISPEQTIICNEFGAIKGNKISKEKARFKKLSKISRKLKKKTGLNRSNGLIKGTHFSSEGGLKTRKVNRRIGQLRSLKFK